ncbi:MAG: ribosome biogenesis GTP-binding protein YihA/YsxC [Woeseiaceae bacterium]|jgi:GTP-binding protein|nr:YihA family ribosome biogenesis GTP-binding protein [Woeseiaceae bacterium]MDG1015557.1 ribosome biogenesis GTP-binding protein YihA/YsxC [Woeseiaceae bacterium]MDG1712293.1 ribosome biogenesis GTP-binding protein YihA/YsxC [Woeseiaceae bacterium]MDG1864698.1 ribosome biogenesis GTP-binding protein YihA/YsxC [Woeseiaceae bacterium]|tara:strand:+ start:312 stop:908 length:597 start_codon:yes stop_codon:yes gene_type:complete
MSQYPKAKFILSANDTKQFVCDEGAEVAFAGRSNSGKSSAINVIVNRRQFARTSKTPGRTQLINFFELNDKKRIVDLPGYGFARVNESVKEHWGRLLSYYFENRESLQGLFVIVDIRRGLSEYDRDMLFFAKLQNIAIHILLTKADKVKRRIANNTLIEVREGLEDSASVQLFSSLKRQGLIEARKIMEEFLTQKFRN